MHTSTPREVRPKTWLETFLDATTRGQLEELQDLLSIRNGERLKPDVQTGLRRALQIASSRGNANQVQLLLEEGASIEPVEKETPALIRAVESGSYSAVKLLLSYPSNRVAYRQGLRSTSVPILHEPYFQSPNHIDHADLKYRSEIERKALFLAVIEGYANVTKELLISGIDPNVRDKEGRTALIHLCAHRKEVRHKHKTISVDHYQYEEVVGLLLNHGLDIEAKGYSASRTALHWAITKGDEEMVTLLLDAPLPRNADVHALAKGRKTALHIAAGKPATRIVELLLHHNADLVTATSQAAWTPLHNAAERGQLRNIQTLVEWGADPQAVTDKGRTALHWAADNGHVDCVRYLISRSGFKRHAKDSTGKSPWMLAAKKHHYKIAQLLSPFNDAEHLSALAKFVCEDYLALVTDVHPQKKGLGKYVTTEKRSMYDLLYAVHDQTEKPTFTVGAKQDSLRKGGFRWIHLPANNMTWAEVLLIKYYKERGAKEVDAFQRTANFLNLQHRGSTVHSQYMRPSCQRILPRSGSGRDGSDFLGDQSVDKWNDEEDLGKADHIQNELRKNLKPIIELAALASPDRTKPKVSSPLKGNFEEAPNQSPVGAFAPPRRVKTGEAPMPKRPDTLLKAGRPGSRLSQHSFDQHSGQCETDMSLDFGETFLFMPYLHFESYAKSQKMSMVLDEVFRKANPKKAAAKAKYDDERGDFEDVMSGALPQERPFLEQSFYSAHDPETASIASTPVTPSLPPDDRIDQQNWSKDVMLTHAYLLEASPLHPRRTLDQFYYPTGNTSDRDQDQVVYRYYLKYGLKEPKVFMVDQLWLWILDNDLVVTSFPYQWEQEDRDESFDLAHAILDDLKEFHLASVYDLASCITNRCSGMFYKNVNLEEYRFLEMFEQSIADLQDEEPELSRQFKKASKDAEQWFSAGSKIEKNPTFDDYFTKVGTEMKLLTEAKDIRTELKMISTVLKEQIRLLPEMQDAVKNGFEVLKSKNKKAQLRTTFNAQVDDINGILARLERMNRDVDEFYQSCEQLLELKQKYAGVFEARYSRMQATSSVRQGHTIMVFTIVTVAFLPISFIATFFEVPVNEFAQSLTLDHVSKVIFLAGLLISVPLVIVALTVDDIIRQWYRLLKWIKSRKNNGPETNDEHEDKKSIVTNDDAATLYHAPLTTRDTEFLREHGHKHTQLSRHLLGEWGHDLFHRHEGKQTLKNRFHPIRDRQVRYDEEKGRSE